jgi:hypothetical protein
MISLSGKGICGEENPDAGDRETAGSNHVETSRYALDMGIFQRADKSMSKTAIREKGRCDWVACKRFNHSAERAMEMVPRGSSKTSNSLLRTFSPLTIERSLWRIFKYPSTSFSGVYLVIHLGNGNLFS